MCSKPRYSSWRVSSVNWSLFERFLCRKSLRISKERLPARSSRIVALKQRKRGLVCLIGLGGSGSLYSYELLSFSLFEQMAMRGRSTIVCIANAVLFEGGGTRKLDIMRLSLPYFSRRHCIPERELHCRHSQRFHNWMWLCECYGLENFASILGVDKGKWGRGSFRRELWIIDLCSCLFMK